MNSKEERKATIKKAIAAAIEVFKTDNPEITKTGRDLREEMIIKESMGKFFDSWYYENHRIFSGIYPTGIVWADRYVEESGDYKRLAYMNFKTLELELDKNCPKKLIPMIEKDVAWYQSKKGEKYEISTCGQYVILGE